MRGFNNPCGGSSEKGPEMEQCPFIASYRLIVLLPLVCIIRIMKFLQFESPLEGNASYT